MVPGQEPLGRLPLSWRVGIMTGKYSLGRLRDKLLTHKKYLVCHLPLLQVTFHGCDRGRPKPARRRPTCTLLGDEEFLVAMGAFIMKTDKMNSKSQDDQSKRVWWLLWLWIWRGKCVCKPELPRKGMDVLVEIKRSNTKVAKKNSVQFRQMI